MPTSSERSRRFSSAASSWASDGARRRWWSKHEPWSTARQIELERAFVQTQLAYGADTWRRVTPVLELYASPSTGVPIL